MIIGNRKEEGRVCTVLLHIIRKSLTPSENWLTVNQNWKKPKSDPGFKPGLPRQNFIPLPLVPSPLPPIAKNFFNLVSWSKPSSKVSDNRRQVDNQTTCSVISFQNHQNAPSVVHAASRLVREVLQGHLRLPKPEGLLRLLLPLQRHLRNRVHGKLRPPQRNVPSGKPRRRRLLVSPQGRKS